MHDGLRVMAYRSLEKYEERNHPRWPKGHPLGGQWKPKGTVGGITYEVAPNPDNKELTERWEKLSDEERQAISDKISKKYTPEVMKALGLEYTVEKSIGGYEGHINPSYIVTTNDNPFQAANALGQVYQQKAMVVLGSENLPGTYEASGASVVIPNASTATLRKVQNRLGDIGTAGWTYRNGRMQFLNFDPNVSNRDFASEIDRRLKGKFKIEHAKIYSSLIEEKNYADPRSTSGKVSWGEVRDRVRSGIAGAIEKELKAVGKAEGEGQVERQVQVLKTDRYRGVFDAARCSYPSFAAYQGHQHDQDP